MNEYEIKLKDWILQNTENGGFNPKKPNPSFEDLPDSMKEYILEKDEYNLVARESGKIDFEVKSNDEKIDQGDSNRKAILITSFEYKGMRFYYEISEDKKELNDSEYGALEKYVNKHLNIRQDLYKYNLITVTIKKPSTYSDKIIWHYEDWFISGPRRGVSSEGVIGYFIKDDKIRLLEERLGRKS